jgi:hypothetical protein
MVESVPAYVSIVFILTTFLTVGFLLTFLRAVSLDTAPSRLLVFVLAFWIPLTGIAAAAGFYQRTDLMPPRLMLFGVLPALILIFAYFVFFRSRLIDRLPLRLLTLLHIVRIPVELVLYWLFISGLVPQVMTFAGRNFDILSGVFALAAYFLAFRSGVANKWLLVAFNLAGLLLLANIVAIAIMSLPSPMQQMAFDQPNRGVLLFPYIWLPTVIVPIVLFSHLASLYKLVTNKLS